MNQIKLWCKEFASLILSNQISWGIITALICILIFFSLFNFCKSDRSHVKLHYKITLFPLMSNYDELLLFQERERYFKGKKTHKFVFSIWHILFSVRMWGNSACFHKNNGHPPATETSAVTQAMRWSKYIQNICKKNYDAIVENMSSFQGKKQF